jgi:chromosome segregation ATPase
MSTGDHSKIKAGSLTGERQDEIRARIQRTLDASRMNAPASGDTGGENGAADPTARIRTLEERLAQTEHDLASARARVAELEASLEQARADHATLVKDKAAQDESLATARRRIEGYAEETVSLRQKVEAIERALARITGHRWYRAWDRLRSIMGKPSLHGPRKDPLGIKPVNPG